MNKNVKLDYIPQWVRNNAKWWANGEISDGEFCNAIEWLIKEGIITIRSKC